MDWRKLIAELVATGLTQSQIATRCGVGQGTVSDLYRGATRQPTYEFGDALLRLHAEKCAPARTA